MIGIDTNILVRLLVSDLPEQGVAARVLLEEAEARSERVFVNRVVLAECLWVLASQYAASKAEALAAVDKLAHHPTLQLEDRSAVLHAVAQSRKSSQQIVDLIIAATNAAKGCEATFTFDKIAARSRHFRLLS